MDDEFRAIERASENDYSATVLLARNAERLGRPSLAFWSRALAQAPRSVDARMGYIGAGGFFVESVRDEYLGPAWKLYNLPVNGQTFNLVYGRKLLQHKNNRIIERTVDQHLENSVAGPEENPGGVAIASTLLQGSIDLAMLIHKDHLAFRDNVQQYAVDQLEKEKRWRITGKFTYGENEQATLEDIALNRTRNSRAVIVPELTDDYVILAPEQPESALGTIASIPENLIPLLTELFGRDYVRVIPAIQYFSRRRNGNLREVYMCTPPLGSRIEVPERALVLGNGVGNLIVVGFVIDCDDGIVNGRPAVGWRSAQNFSSRN